jgi:hypothetical protein
MDACTIVEDNRKIVAVYNNGHGYRLGHGGVTCIQPYDELGELAPITWFAIFVGDRVKFRMRADFVEYA